MARKRKVVFDYVRGHNINMFAYMTEFDYLILSVITSELMEIFSDTTKEERREWALKTLQGRSDEMMVEERNDDVVETKTTDQEGIAPTSNEQVDTEVQAASETQEETTQQLPIEVAIFKHLTSIARLLDMLRQIYPDLNADFGPELDRWLSELNSDCERFFGITVTE